MFTWSASNSIFQRGTHAADDTPSRWTSKRALTSERNRDASSSALHAFMQPRQAMQMQVVTQHDHLPHIKDDRVRASYT